MKEIKTRLKFDTNTYSQNIQYNKTLMCISNSVELKYQQVFDQNLNV